MRFQQYDGSSLLTMTASEWRQDEADRFSWVSAAGGRFAVWSGAGTRSTVDVDVVDDRDPSAGVYISAPTADAIVVAAAGDRVGCSWLERGGWPLARGYRMVQVGEDLEQAAAIAQALRLGRPDLAAAIDARIAALKRRRRRKPANAVTTGAPHALAA